MKFLDDLYEAYTTWMWDDRIVYLKIFLLSWVWCAAVGLFLRVEIQFSHVFWTFVCGTFGYYSTVMTDEGARLLLKVFQKGAKK